ncbi:bifunctional methylenetetrahydrofolate dehydrogenase/methenyltetrahydrofolate cyclohydrolase [Segeticoccus rhizosphaerae]|jgi:methylenetetrahydrofolate dehydrogenase (NADP+)/methenyltetrahydrofolate cyclohydrolase|uniref:bifunctional methylenetetrahydrofolate dehydrogenase/methenyltetrahydrofolate cyclohydrolase n=1 Tax=Segeticoccus rhizosphaerae TaxID=1104777 RepID=UPI0012645E4D|nr:bifunctional methylenetetrahydrofolate dehydrogenase/methenyltetrahydrofolate cyclohydrolase [Segeticoccus rhizosphaerae]
MSARVLDPAEVARSFAEEVRGRVAALGRPLRIVGLLTQADGPAATYARYARQGAESVGIKFDLVQPAPEEVVTAIQRANVDPDVHGIFLYYPLLGAEEDRWLRELVDPRKDIEGMHSFWSRNLYENLRWLDGAHTHKAILPCTPLAILKLLDAAGIASLAAPGPLPLSGVTACVINRSDIVGRPLAAMLANDGAEVVSLDLDGTQVFEPAGRHLTHTVRDSDETRAEALARAEVVITGVPSREFRLVAGEEIRAGAICVNFSQFRNFDDSIRAVASVFVPRVGPMTVTMATRNLTRLAGMAGAPSSG